MKQKLVLLATLLTLGLATSTQAAVLFQENFESYPIGPLLTNDLSTSPWFGNTGTPANGSTGGIQVVADPTGNSVNALQVSQALTQDIKAAIATNNTSADVLVNTNVTGTLTNLVYGFSPSNSVNALYESMTIYVTALPTGAPTYFTHFTSDASGFRARVFIITNGAASGSFRLAIQNGGTAVTNTIPTDLSLDTSYTIVTRYILSTCVSTLWLNPTSETSTTSVNGGDTQTPTEINAYSYRQNSGEGVVDVDNLKVGTTFADVVPGSVNPPTFLTQPIDTNAFEGGSITLKTLALGDPTITYRWYYNTNTLLSDNGTTIAGSASNVLTLTNLNVGQSGTYSCVASNGSGTNVTRYAVLTVSLTPLPPVITNEPVSVTNTVGDTVSLTVGATGLPTPSYQWKSITTNGVNLVTNNVAGANITGTNTSTLTFNGILLNQAGAYFCTLTNIAGYQTTNTSLATITVNPPPTISIADFRSRVDNTFAPTNTTSIFTLQGTVTTWTNMTTSRASTEFYMQDDSAGIAVFWSGANPSTNLPPAGSVVRVTGPAAAFSGLLEIEPVFTNTLHGITIVSSNNSLPNPQPLPFDPNIQADMATMKKMEGMYFVASNVFLDLNEPNFSSASPQNNEPVTNNVTHVKTFNSTALSVTYTNGAGQTFTFFVNGATDIPGQTKPTGPVTVFGVLGFFTAAGFEFTPSRYADIVSYTHSTNVLSHLTRLGDAPTNTFAESVLRPGENLAMSVSVGDPEGGTVTLAPVTDGLPASAYWTNVTGGTDASATFVFAPTSGDTGTNYVIALASTTTAGTSTNLWYVYVPTPQEQQVYISEFLANPTTNSSLASYNPLHRLNDTNNVAVNDQFVELVNQSGTDLDLFGWSLTDASTRKHTFVIGAPVEQLAASSSNAVVVYGGPKTGDPSAPQLPVPSFPANVTTGLGLASSGNGVIVLRNPNYYNNGLGLQPGYIVDRVVYNASELATNSSLTRFPLPNGNSRFVPQALVNTNGATAGLQFDGSTWLTPTQIPQAATNVTVVPGNPVKLNFPADQNKVSTLWQANTLMNTFNPMAGQKFGTASGQFSVTNPPAASQFYYITTQTNY